MFKYPNGKNFMNTIVWFSGMSQIVIGVGLLFISFAGNGVDLQSMFQQFPELALLLSGSMVFIGGSIVISGFTIVMFAEVHMYQRANNKMLRKIYDSVG